MDYQVIIIGIYSVYNPFYLIKIIMYMRKYTILIETIPK